MLLTHMAPPHAPAVRTRITTLAQKTTDALVACPRLEVAWILVAQGLTADKHMGLEILVAHAAESGGIIDYGDVGVVAIGHCIGVGAIRSGDRGTGFALFFGHGSSKDSSDRNALSCRLGNSRCTCSGRGKRRRLVAVLGLLIVAALDIEPRLIGVIKHRLLRLCGQGLMCRFGWLGVRGQSQADKGGRVSRGTGALCEQGAGRFGASGSAHGGACSAVHLAAGVAGGVAFHAALELEGAHVLVEGAI